MQKSKGVNFSRALKDTRRKAGLSQVKAAAKCGIPRRTWENWESEVNTPAVYVQEAVIKLLTEK